MTGTANVATAETAPPAGTVGASRRSVGRIWCDSYHLATAKSSRELKRVEKARRKELLNDRSDSTIL